MSLLEKTENLLGDESGHAPLWHILGPLFILSAYALSPHDPWILGVGVVGLLLSSRWQIRGFSYALALLGIAAACEHLWLTERHLWQLGLEGSYAIAFLITALSSEQRTCSFQSLSSQINARDASIRNLEEEAVKTHESATSNQIAMQEKIDALQKELEGVQSDFSSILLLNEVLRKTEAIHAEEKAFAQGELLDAQRKMVLLQEELKEAERMAARLTDGNALADENRTLAAELNAMRYGREQLRLISETIAREHAKENLRASEATARLAELQSQFTSLKLESDILNVHLTQFSAERDRFHLAQKTYEEVQTERNFLKERLAHAELELSLKAQAPVEELTHLQQTVEALAKFESLYKQLRAQFEEKNTILHQTRAALFRTDTELQTCLIEMDQRDVTVDPLMKALEEENGRLESENRELESLITHLTTPTTPVEKKN